MCRQYYRSNLSEAQRLRRGGFAVFNFQVLATASFYSLCALVTPDSLNAITAEATQPRPSLSALPALSTGFVDAYFELATVSSRRLRFPSLPSLVPSPAGRRLPSERCQCVSRRIFKFCTD